VIISTHNRADSCVRAVESALAQTLSPLEVIVCDDRSSDDTEATISALAASDERVRYLRRTSGPRGPGATRNRALQEAHGEFVAFLDDDDEWFDEKLRLQVPEVSRSRGLICSNAVRTSGGTYFDESTDRVIGRQELFEHNPVILSTAMIPRWAVSGAGGFSESSRLSGIEDYDLWLRLSDRGIKMKRLGEPLAVYSDLEPGRLSSAEVGLALALSRMFVTRALRQPTDALVARKAFSSLIVALKQTLAAMRSSRTTKKTAEDRSWLTRRNR
jgi:glycosyltransferase involved in cell wall biosynthesis